MVIQYNGKENPVFSYPEDNLLVATCIPSNVKDENTPFYLNTYQWIVAYHKDAYKDPWLSYYVADIDKSQTEEQGNWIIVERGLYDLWERTLHIGI